MRFVKYCSVVIICIILLSSCKPENKEFNVTSEARLEVFLTGVSFDFLPHMKSINTQKYNYLTVKKNTYEKVLERFTEFVFSRVHRETVSIWYEKINSIKDFYLQRQVELLTFLYLCNSVEYSPEIIKSRNSIISEINNLRILYKEQSINIHEFYKSVLEDNTINADDFRMITENTFSPLVKEFQSLVKKRNDSARMGGSRNFADLVLQTENIDRSELLDILNRLKQATDKTYSQIQGKDRFSGDISLFKMMFSDYFAESSADYSGDTVEKRIRAFFKSIDLSLNINDEYVQWDSSIPSAGFNFAIPGKYKSLITTPSYTKQRAEDLTEHYFNAQYYSNLTDEKIMLLGYSNVIGAKSRIFGFSVKELLNNLMCQIDSGVRYRDKDEEILFIRKLLFYIEFELIIYEEQEPDLLSIYSNLAKKYFNIDDVTPGLPEPLMLYSMTDSPFNSACHLYGIIVADQVFDSLLLKIPPESQYYSQYGIWLKKYIFKYGELYKWSKKLYDISGSDLNLNSTIIRLFDE